MAKIRNGFVSNSSSSSFIIRKNDLTQEQIDIIKNYANFVMGLPNNEIDKEYFDSTAWEIRESEDTISGYTYMNNWSIGELFGYIGIEPTAVEWDDDGWGDYV